MKTKMLFFLLAILFLALQSCSPPIRTNLSGETLRPLQEEDQIIVLEVGEEVPQNSQYLGELKIGDYGFSKGCSYLEVMDLAKKTARQSGANLIVLTKLKDPSFSSKCYRVKGKLYKNEDRELLTQLQEKKELKNKSRLTGEEDYAIVHFYRPKRYVGSIVGYKVRFEGEKIGRVRNGEKFEYKITDFGKKEFWAKTESKSVVEIDIKKGEEYFIRCDLYPGWAVGKPKLSLTENQIGIKEYEELK